jgi:hypothetical protein
MRVGKFKTLLITGLVCAVGWLAGVGCSSRELDEAPKTDQVSWAKLATQVKQISEIVNRLPDSSEHNAYVLEHAMRCKRAVLFPHFDWSFTSVLMQGRFWEFAEQFSEAEGNEYLAFHYGNFTNDYSNNPQLHEWAKRFETGLTGDGEAFWFENGQIVSVKSLWELKTWEDFRDHSRQVFGADSVVKDERKLQKR